MNSLDMEDASTARETLLGQNVNVAVTTFSVGHLQVTVSHVTVMRLVLPRCNVILQGSVYASRVSLVSSVTSARRITLDFRRLVVGPASAPLKEVTLVTHSAMKRASVLAKGMSLVPSVLSVILASMAWKARTHMVANSVSVTVTLAFVE